MILPLFKVKWPSKRSDPPVPANWDLGSFLTIPVRFGIPGVAGIADDDASAVANMKENHFKIKSKIIEGVVFVLFPELLTEVLWCLPQEVQRWKNILVDGKA
jgi:hypothetical protein